MNISVDINCDMGEGMMNESLIMPFISSASIACGFHAGDANTMQQTLELAMQHRVAAGAHPSYPDKENFGRTHMHFQPDAIYDIVKEQVDILANIAARLNYPLHHVKPHGALYNMAATDKTIATAICRAVLATDKDLLIYAPNGSCLIEAARHINLRTCNEVFADRTYQADGSLTPRNQPHALLHNVRDMAAQVLLMVTTRTVNTTGGTTIPVIADTICIHGDGEHAVEFARAIYDLLSMNNITIKSG